MGCRHSACGGSLEPRVIIWDFLARFDVHDATITPDENEIQRMIRQMTSINLPQREG
jgi:hypothetical protein